jgi:hypothetical protein
VADCCFFSSSQIVLLFQLFWCVLVMENGKQAMMNLWISKDAEVMGLIMG